MAGRHQESTRTGPTYQLAEFMNKNWDVMVGRTNDDVAQELGYRAANMISMWRTGKTRISLERLPDIARIMKVDIAVLIPLWFDQYWGDRPDAKILSSLVFNRISSTREIALLAALREAAGNTDPIYTQQQVRAMVGIMTDPDVIAATIAVMDGKSPKPAAPTPKRRKGEVNADPTTNTAPVDPSHPLRRHTDDAGSDKE